MTDDAKSPHEANDQFGSPAGSPARKLWFVSGMALWIIALALLYRTFPSQQRNDQEAGSSAGSVLVLDSKPGDGTTGDGATASNASDEKTTGKIENAETAWDQHGIEDFSLTERSGKTVTKADLLGHDWVVSFIFINCAGPCPRVTGQMHELQEHLKGTDVRLVTITVDPQTDTPERLAKYADAFNADRDRWLFLTGDMVKIYRLIGGSFKMPVMQTEGKDRKPGYEVIHTTNILHVNAKGVVVGKYNSLNEVDMAKLRQKLKAK